MKAEILQAATLHAPHGTDLFVCPKCFQEFVALFLFNKHVREVHDKKEEAKKP